ncbi:MAG: hypothetical protein RLZZ182_2320 [Pseudomonadota bacterium]|jgi:peptide deformylase
MPVREILKMGDARLLRVAQPVPAFDTPELHALVRDLLDTMAAAHGAGIAAPQIGVDLQVVVFGSGEINPRYPDQPPVPRTVLCNPVITPLTAPLNTSLMPPRTADAPDTAPEEEDGWEGCLSVPGLRGQVPRWRRIRYTGTDPEGRPIDREAEGFHARVVQHECDHLIGRLYPTRMRDLTTLGYTAVLFPELGDGVPGE